jgi:4-diphosphocytidyl-2-C-methyl-D-erythritol kinase
VTTRVAARAYAKLNLWLRVLAREESGYHSIETLFHRIELADEVMVELAPVGERAVRCSEDVGPAEQNLAYRAAVTYCESVKWATGFRIEIDKRIPAGGGLGGGSADAAATLLALNAMAPRRLSEAELAELARQLGADVPFLVTNAVAALAWGRGDRMVTLGPLPARHVALVIPPFPIDTAAAYASVRATEARASAVAVEALSDWAEVARRAANDLADSGAALRHPGLRNAVRALSAAGATIAAMTGSGSVLFGVFDSEPDAESLEEATGWKVVLTRTALNVEAPVSLD